MAFLRLAIPCFTAIFLLFLFSFNELKASTEKYRIMWRTDPATSMVIGWNQVSGSNPIVYFDTVDHGTNWSNYSNSQTVDHAVVAKGMDNRFVRLTNLLPNTAYYFVIHDSDGVSARMWFKTTPNVATERLAFIAGGDSRNNRTPRINANKIVSKLRPHAVLFGGDYTDSGTNAQWDDWFDDWQFTIGSDGRMIPIVAARGNHESSNSDLENLFDVPNSSVYYALTFGGNLLRSYTLNTEISIGGTQTTWLSNDLSASSETWRIAQYHKPMRPHVAGKAEGSNQYTYWSGLFKDHDVKLVVECDAHTVKTTWPIVPSTSAGSDEGFVRDDANGTVYTGEGCWGAPLRSNDDNKIWTRSSGMFNQVKWIFVDQNAIELRTLRVDNADQVGQVNDNDIFTPPTNLDIWDPIPYGDVVVIPNNDNTSWLSKQVVQSADDAEESASGVISINSSDLELVEETGVQTVGIRFQDITIPPGSNILSAHIEFTIDETSSGNTTLSIYGEDEDDSNAFTTSSFNISTRKLTSTSVSWSNIPSWSTIGAKGYSADVAPIINEIIDRPGWQSGNDLSLLISGSGARVAESFDGSSGDAAHLVINYTESALPVDLEKFDAALDQNFKVKLDWVTNSEVDNKIFEIERSTDGNTFEVIGAVNGAGNSTNISTYEFMDKSPFFGRNYYRLKQIDYDSKFTYSKVKTVLVGQNEIKDILIYPNPTSTKTTVRMLENLKKAAVLELVNASGEMTQSVHIKSGESAIDLDMSSEAAGIYFIFIKFNGHRQLIDKLVKLGN